MGQFAPKKGKVMRIRGRKVKKKAIIVSGVVLIMLIVALIFVINKDKVYETFNVNVSISEQYQTTKEQVPKTLKEWQEINSDVVFLLKFQDADILHNIPVVYTDDGDYYMKHNLYGNYDTMGAVFMEKQDSPIDSSNNYLINGHASKTKNWSFTFLKNYVRKSYFDANGEFILEDDVGEHKYKIVSFAEYDIDQPEVYLDWYNNVIQDYEHLKEIMTKSEPYILNRIDGYTYQGQQLITLITCNMDKENSRYVLTAIEVEN